MSRIIQWVIMLKSETLLIENSTIGDETKISHLTYVGDSVIGKKANLDVELLR